MSLTRHQHKYQADHTILDRYLIVVHIPSGRKYSLNKKFQVNYNGKGICDECMDYTPDPKRKKWIGTFPEAKPNWAVGIPEDQFSVYQMYDLNGPL